MYFERSVEQMRQESAAFSGDGTYKGGQFTLMRRAMP
jgi:hypothetical protein